MESVYSRREECCGCSACFNICPTDAISMIPDEEGFLYPLIDQDTCIDCNKCVNSCPILKDNSFKEERTPDLYVTKHKSIDVLMSSTSGGMFAALSDAILREDGIIYGVDFDDEFKVLHKRAENPEQRDRMKFSKYVQSDLSDIFQQIKNDLIDGKSVLFTGTPCQTAGLRGYFRNSRITEKLYICDLICHSIPSPLIWKDFKKYLEKENGGELTNIQFRSKIIDWTRENSNKTFMFKTTANEDYVFDERYYKLFFGLKTIVRPSCSECRFTDVHRTSDITIADYWGIEKYAPEWLDLKGVSLILTNTQKGDKLLELISQDIHFEKRQLKEALNEQQRLSKPVESPDNRDEFWKIYKEKGFEYIMENMLG
ncbi:Coenzyme F420 hydrogenase/dehydrogenase, beta subunit C-terminal domain [Tissierella sp. Yu-01]|uniref:Coenzyme F420 hydrogenase/dehydrogenase, beta subunit C-terminal domain n=1 Tax=Tissierella sp. Yu-01 TaxID=3035694 RepID=UPI00240D5A34|nr:Coenzyme F420 hydrogenase/dehydrogenase, beta subunit C-terminal domain [Tissierella sp. Yu-01]WFA08428.1 Coenzyme F420 hydrogenase/dehydrogenase, beta subunit C-terminal domain [Tissierella sp. Yu-01]